MGIVKKRPVNLDLRTIRFPLTAIVSILHRLSGLFIFISVPFLLWALAASVDSPESFYHLQSCLTQPGMKALLTLLIAATIYHTFAGMRHILMDCGLGESLQSGRLGAKLVLLSSAVTVVLLGVWLWA